MSFINYSLTELSQQLKEKKASAREITDAFIAQSEKEDPQIKAYLTTTFDLARQQADAADSRRQSGSPLSDVDGLPVALKDLICTKGIRTTAASKVLENFVPPYDATVWSKLKSAGMVILGKLNCDEFAMGGTNENSAYFPTKNPRNTDYVPGGSSGGSAAAVAAKMCPLTIGTDTGGSIRQPAHYCGVTGLKVSYGRTSRYGVTAMASSLDTIGPLANRVEDLALALQVMAGQDPKDQTTSPHAVPNFRETLNEPLRGRTFGFLSEDSLGGVSDETLQSLQSVRAQIEEQGGKIATINLNYLEESVATYYLIVASEVSANLARYDGLRFGQGISADNLEEIYQKSRAQLGPEVQRRILLGTYALSAGYYEAYYRKAQKVRTLIRQDFDEAFTKVEAIIMPVAPREATRFDQKLSIRELYLQDILTIPASLAGICGLSLPVAQTKEGLPLGVQILTPAFTEERALNIGQMLEQKNSLGSS